MEHRQEREKKPRMIICVWGPLQSKHSTVRHRVRTQRPHATRNWSWMTTTTTTHTHAHTHMTHTNTHDSLNKMPAQT